MADVFDRRKRSEVMRAVKSTGTSAERIVEEIIRSIGFRGRGRGDKLPGSPDIVLPVIRTAVFVHGCFWHRHTCPKGQTVPATRRSFWLNKFAGNLRRDRRAKRALVRLGWKVVVVWECRLTVRHREGTRRRLFRLFSSSPTKAIKSSEKRRRTNDKTQST